MKVICTSQQENVAQSLSIHKTSLVTTGKFTASMRMEEFLQTILCRQNRCERSHLFLRAPQSTRISHPTTGAIWDQEHGPKGGDEINIIKKVLIMDGPL
jgi:hypothetical protein